MALWRNICLLWRHSTRTFIKRKQTLSTMEMQDENVDLIIEEVFAVCRVCLIGPRRGRMLTHSPEVLELIEQVAEVEVRLMIVVHLPESPFYPCSRPLADPSK